MKLERTCVIYKISKAQERNIKTDKRYHIKVGRLFTAREIINTVQSQTTD